MKKINVAKKRNLNFNSDVSNRLVKGIVDIQSDRASSDEILFQHSVLSQCFLPYSRPVLRDGRKTLKDADGTSLEKMEWEVSNGRASLMMSHRR